MDTDQVLRDDFPLVRKGWDPEAVRAHLSEVEEELRRVREAPMADAAAYAVREIVASVNR